jgi:hypothetical protein
MAVTFPHRQEEKKRPRAKSLYDHMAIAYVVWGLHAGKKTKNIATANAPRRVHIPYQTSREPQYPHMVISYLAWVLP